MNKDPFPIHLTSLLLIAIAALFIFTPTTSYAWDPAQPTKPPLPENKPGNETDPTPELSPTPEASPTPQPEPTEQLQPEGWVYGDTSVSDLDPQGQALLLGVPPEVHEWEEAQREAGLLAPEPSVTYTYPPSLDWRYYLKKDYTTPIRNQSGCGSCVAFGTAGAIESRLEIAVTRPSLDPDLSEGHLFFCGCGECCSYGWWPSAALSFAQNTGIADEPCQPYVIAGQLCNPCSDWENRVTTISRWYGIWNVDEAKQAIATFGPVEVTFLVYSDFYGYKGGIYRHESGSYVGSHAVAVVGYNDEEGYWIVKNSWGTGWGEDGWFRIAYGEVGIDNYFYVPVVHCDDPFELNNQFKYASPIPLNSAQEAYFCPDGDVDIYRFELNHHEWVYIDVDAESIGSDLDPKLYLYRTWPEWKLIDSNDNTDGLDPQIETWLPAKGSYYLKLTNRNRPPQPGSEYNYQFIVQTCTDPYERNNTRHQATPLDFNENLIGPQICPRHDVDFYTFYGKAGQKIEIEILSKPLGSSLKPMVILYGPRGFRPIKKAICNGLGDCLKVRLTKTGNYYVLVMDKRFPRAGGPGYQYEIRLSRRR